MIVPVRCFSCGKVIGDKWEDFKEMFIGDTEAKRAVREAEAGVNYDRH